MKTFVSHHPQVTIFSALIANKLTTPRKGDKFEGAFILADISDVM